MAASAETRGRRALKAALESGAWTQVGIAREIGIAQPSVSAWVAGHSRPDDLRRKALERLLGIKAEWWMTDAEFRVAFGRSRAA